MSSEPAEPAWWLDPESATYPDSDGEPMSDNTEQFEFIQRFQANLDLIRTDFVAGDHLWYPVLGHPEIRMGPDVYVAVGRPKGHRGSYRQWREANVPLTVVFEWWSPNATFAHALKKHKFYETYGVKEFYAFDQTRKQLTAFWRTDDGLEAADTSAGITSPILGIRMAVQDEELLAWLPDGRPFLTLRGLDESLRAVEAERAQAEAERDRAEAERDRAEAQRAQADERTRRLEERLRALGIDPD